MIDQTINDIVDEVSLEGSEGCTFDQLFVFVKNLFTKALKGTSLNAPILFDDNYKSYLWMHLRNMEQLIFTLDNTVIDPSKFSYQEMKDKAQGELVIRATEESQDTSIYGSLKGEKKNLGEIPKLLLGVIAKCRSQGIGQFQLAEKLNLDSKGVFYHLKKLDNLGLIVKESAYTDKMNTRIIFLKRFSKQDQDTETDTDGDLYRVGNFKDNLLKQLSSAKDNMMSLQDAIKVMGFVKKRSIRWARVRISELHEQGIVEKFTAYDGRIEKPSVRIRNTTEDIAIKEKEDVHNDHATNNKRQELFYRDLSGEYQFFQDIVASGEKGLVRQDLSDKYPHIDSEIIKTFLDNVILTPKSQDCAKYAVYRAEELGGKTRLYRYFDYEGWKKFNEKMGKTVSELKITSKTRAPILEEPKSINQIGKSFGIIPKTKIPIKRSLDKNENASGNGDEDRPKSKKNKVTPVSALENEDSQPKITQSVPKRVTHSSKPNTSIISTKDQTSANKRKSDSLEDREKDVSSSTTQKEIPAHSEILVFENSFESQPKKAKKGSSILNSTKVRRCQIFLEMMDKQHIRELNTDLANDFNEIEKAAAGGQKMAVTTFNNMVKQLHEEKKLKLFVTSIQKPFGLNEIKTLVLHNSLSEDSVQVKQFLEIYKTERPIMQSKAKRKQLKKVKVEEIPSIEETTKELPKHDKVGPLDYTSDAFEYGWIKSRWHRSRELHESLMEFYVFSKASDHIIDMKEYIKFVSLHTLIKIVSNMPYESEEFRKFIDVEENRRLSLGDVPENIRLLVYQSRLRIRLLLNHFLKILVALDLIKAIEEKDNEYLHAIAPKYFLNEEGFIKDYAFKDRAIVKTLPLTNVEDVRYFWEELQSNCVHPSRYRTEQDKKELEEWADENDPLYNIHLNRSWVTEIVLTARQREILDSFIDENSLVIPSDNAPLRTHLARMTKLTPKRIRLYYAGVMRALLRKQNKEEKTKAMLQKKLSMPKDSTIDDLMLASKEKRKVNMAIKDLKQQSPFVLSTYIGSRRVRRLRVRTEPYNEKVTSGRGNSSTKFLTPDSLENDLLLYAYCIMKTRAKIGQFFWDPITKLLTDKNKHQCRRAFNIMKKRDPGLLITIERLMFKWEKYYKEGIQANKIRDENPWNTLEFDLPAFVEYFIIRLQEEESIITNPLHTLPSKFNVLLSTYTIIRDAPLILQTKKEEHQYSVTVSIFDEDTYDARPEILHSSDEAREIDLVKTLIKMLLMTPDNLYNSEVAFSVFSQYTHKVIEDAISSLKDEGLIVRDKSGYGRIPGRKFNVSEKFLRISEGALPHGLVDDARFHYKNIASSKTLGLNKALSGGTVASTLALMSQYKVSIFRTSDHVYKKLRDSFYYPKAAAVSLRKAFMYKDLDLSLKRNVPISPIIKISATQNRNAKIIIPEPNQIETCIQGMMNVFPLANTVYNAVKSSTKNGISLCDIIHYVKDVERKEIDIQQIANTVYRLMKHEPSLIQVVGFDQPRYIASEFMSSWLLKTEVDKNFIKPLMWNDVTGNTIEIALDGCLNAVISHILTKPGISHVNLRKKFEKFFTEYELYTLIGYLEESNIILVRKIQRSSRPKRISIFDKRPVLCTANNATLINSNEVTCYWISSDYYI